MVNEWLLVESENQHLGYCQQTEQKGAILIVDLDQNSNFKITVIPSASHRHEISNGVSPKQLEFAVVPFLKNLYSAVQSSTPAGNGKDR